MLDSPTARLDERQYSSSRLLTITDPCVDTAYVKVLFTEYSPQHLCERDCTPPPQTQTNAELLARRAGLRKSNENYGCTLQDLIPLIYFLGSCLWKLRGVRVKKGTQAIPRGSRGDVLQTEPSCVNTE